VPTVERIRHTSDSHGQILAVAFRSKPLKCFKLFPLRSEAVWEGARNLCVVEDDNGDLEDGAGEVLVAQLSDHRHELREEVGGQAHDHLVQGLGFRVSGFGFRVSGLGFRV